MIHLIIVKINIQLSIKQSLDFVNRLDKLKACMHICIYIYQNTNLNTEISKMRIILLFNINKIIFV